MAKKPAGNRQRKPERIYVPKFANQFQKVWTDADIETIADDMLEWFGAKENIWLKDFAVERMVHFQRFAEWAERNAYFGFVFQICKHMQESKLVKLGLSKQINAAMPIFALKNVAGWRDQHELTGAGGKPLIPETTKDPFIELAEICLASGVTFPGNNDGNGGKTRGGNGKAGKVEGASA